MDITSFGTLLMAFMTLALAVATFIMVYRVKKTGEDDMKAHKEDRELDAKMHSREHVISFAHLEAEHLGGLKPDTQQVIDKIKKKIL